MKSVSRIFLFLLIILTTNTLNIFSQDKSKSIIGKLINSEDNKVIAYANIINSYNKNGTISNALGVFNMPTDTNYNSLIISAIGYFTKAVSINTDSINLPLIIELNPQVYNINQVIIYPISVKEFKHQFVYNEFSKDSVDLLRDNLKTKFNSPEALKALAPKGIKINYISKKEKQEEKLVIITDYSSLQKNNLDRIRKLTKLESKELIAFEKYCKFSYEFLKYTGKYEIYEEIQRKFEAYKKLKY